MLALKDVERQAGHNSQTIDQVGPQQQQCHLKEMRYPQLFPLQVKTIDSFYKKSAMGKMPTIYNLSHLSKVNQCELFAKI